MKEFIFIDKTLIKMSAVAYIDTISLNENDINQESGDGEIPTLIYIGLNTGAQLSVSVTINEAIKLKNILKTFADELQ